MTVLVSVPVGVIDRSVPELVARAGAGSSVHSIAGKLGWALPQPAAAPAIQVQTEVPADGDMCRVPVDRLGSLYASCCGQVPVGHLTAATMKKGLLSTQLYSEASSSIPACKLLCL